MIGIIPAAGKGLRFKELGKYYPKCILPLNEKPIIYYNIKELESQGCNKIYIVINHQQNEIKNIIKIFNFKVNIIFKVQENLNGLSGAIYEVIKNDINDSVLIILGDIIANIKNVSYDNNFISVQEVNDYSRWCMVKINDNNKYVEKFYDKPLTKPNTNLAVSGVYYFKNTNKLKLELEKQFKNNEKISSEFQLSTIMNNFDLFTYDTNYINIKDYGTLNDYLKNKNITFHRIFNKIIFKDNITYKYSKNVNKIINEYNWFKTIPYDIKLYTPRIINSNFFNNNYYSIEQLPFPTLKDVYLYLDRSNETWEIIFKSLFSLIDKMKKYKSKEINFFDTILNKTKIRCENLEKTPLLKNFFEDFKNEIKKFKLKNTLMHGDFCLSNIIYDLQNDKPYMIDPNGIIYGNYYYDIAKLIHSILYDYDFINSELYIINSIEDYTIFNNGTENIKKIFKNKLESTFTKKELKFLTILTASLFLSMIPLHYHNKTNQQIYYNIFEKCYNDYKKGII